MVNNLPSRSPRQSFWLCDMLLRAKTTLEDELELNAEVKASSMLVSMWPESGMNQAAGWSAGTTVVFLTYLLITEDSILQRDL